jgi:hypothetical protein
VTPKAFASCHQRRYSAHFIFMRVLVRIGAGVSAESGIPTFRGREGYWRNLDPAELATLEAFAHTIRDESGHQIAATLHSTNLEVFGIDNFAALPKLYAIFPGRKPGAWLAQHEFPFFRIRIRCFA